MTLNGVKPLFCVVSPNSIALQAYYVTVVENKPIMSVKYCLPATFSKTVSAAVAESHRLVATAELLVLI